MLREVVVSVRFVCCFSLNAKAFWWDLVEGFWWKLKQVSMMYNPRVHVERLFGCIRRQDSFTLDQKIDWLECFIKLGYFRWAAKISVYGQFNASTHSTESPGPSPAAVFWLHCTVTNQYMHCKRFNFQQILNNGAIKQSKSKPIATLPGCLGLYRAKGERLLGTVQHSQIRPTPLVLLLLTSLGTANRKTA